MSLTFPVHSFQTDVLHSVFSKMMVEDTFNVMIWIKDLRLHFKVKCTPVLKNPAVKYVKYDITSKNSDLMKVKGHNLNELFTKE